MTSMACWIVGHQSSPKCPKPHHPKHPEPPKVQTQRSPQLHASSSRWSLSRRWLSWCALCVQGSLGVVEPRQTNNKTLGTSGLMFDLLHPLLHRTLLLWHGGTAVQRAVASARPSCEATETHTETHRKSDCTSCRDFFAAAKSSIAELLVQPDWMLTLQLNDGSLKPKTLGPNPLKQQKLGFRRFRLDPGCLAGCAPTLHCHVLPEPTALWGGTK